MAQGGTFITDTAHTEIITESDVGNTAADCMAWFDLKIYDPRDSGTLTSVGWEMGKQKADGSMAMSDGWGKYNTAADTDAIRLVMASGNIASGDFHLYGWANS